MQLPSLCLVLTLLMWRAEGQAPRILQVSVLEESPPGTLVSSLRRDVGLDQSEVRFAFLPLATTSLGQGLFSLNETSGDITTTRRIDRDVICPSQAECYLYLDVQLQPLEFFKIVKLRVTVLDINDNSPYFAEEIVAESLSESSPVGTTFTVAGARDPDSPLFGIQRYVIQTETEAFGLKKPSPGGLPSEDIQLVLLRPLDRESRASYSVSLLAVDGGSPSRTGATTIDVTILDVNDNRPIFSQSTYDVTVVENLPVGSTILGVQAHDPDSGARGQVVYSLSDRTAAQHGDLFSIHPTEGVVTCAGELDYELSKAYQLVVTASDREPGSLPSQAKVTINVLDLNDNAPAIRLKTDLTQGRLVIQENSPNETFVAHFSVSDADVGENGEFQCSLNSPDFTLEQLYVTDYKIVTSRVLDREQRENYTLDVVCFDKGATSLSSTLTLPVEVTDVNDEAPVFVTPSVDVLYIPEDTPQGTRLLNVRATDQDAGENANVTYSIVSYSNATLTRFVIDSESGEFSTNWTLDREVEDVLNVSIEARDGGTPSLLAVRTVTIHITDVDDNGAMFSQATYSFYVEENSPSGAVVGSVQATDPDLPPHNAFHYSIHPPVIRALLAVHPHTGDITTVTSPDREVISTMIFTVVAVSDTELAYVTSATVTVLVLDVNDNAPVLLFPTPDNGTIHVDSAVAIPGDVIANVIATDADDMSNGVCAFKIIAGNEGRLFSLDPLDGSLRLEKSLSDFPASKSFFLRVLVADCGSPSRNATAILEISLRQEVETAFRAAANRNTLIGIVCVSVVVAAILVVLIVFVARWRRRVQRKQGWIAWMVEHRIRMSPKTSGSQDSQNWDYLPDDLCQSKVAPPIEVEIGVKPSFDTFESDNYITSLRQETPTIDRHGDLDTVTTDTDIQRSYNGVRRKLTFDRQTDNDPVQDTLPDSEVQCPIPAQFRAPDEDSGNSTYGGDSEPPTAGMTPEVRGHGEGRGERQTIVRFNLVPEVAPLPAAVSLTSISGACSEGSEENGFGENEI